MIELATSPIHGRNGALIARRKLRGLSLALGFDEVGATHLSVGVSELCRRLAGASLTIGLEAEPPAIVLRCLADEALCTLPLWPRFFQVERLPGGQLELRAPLPPGRALPLRELDRLRSVVADRSPEELMLEIQAKNEQLRRHSEELEATVTRRTAELRQASDLAEQANRAKSAFLSSMSHELRTPLNGVLGYAQILLRDPQASPEQRRNLDAIARCGQHLLALINDVLDLSKIESGNLELRWGDAAVGGLVQSVADMVRPRAEAKGLAFRVEVDPGLPAAIRTDEAKLRQVLVNLAGNAVKFTRAGRVALGARSEGGALVFTVRDTGDGIAADQLQLIFDPFRQSDAGRAHGGTGLGLAISKRIVEAMDGSLEVESQLGAGSTFTVRLPLRAAAPAADRPAAGATGADFHLPPGVAPPLLVVDDREENRDLLGQLLAGAGFEVGLAGSGAEALERLDERPWAAVLLDLRMPGLSGYEVVARLRRDPGREKLCVIAVTADVLEGGRDRVLAAGFDDFVAKPIEAGALFQTLARHLDLAAAGAVAAERAGPAAGAGDGASPAGLDATRTSFGVASPVAFEATLVTPGSDRHLPPSEAHRMAARLRELAELGDVAALASLGQELGGELGRRLRGLADGFDFDGVTRLADELAPA